MSELHELLSASNIDLEEVRALVEANPDIVTTVNARRQTPLHVLLDNSSVNNNFDVVLIEDNASFERLTPFLIACSNTNATAALTGLLLDAYPGCIQQRSPAMYGGHHALHLVCANEGLKRSDTLDIAKLLVARNRITPASLFCRQIP